MKRQITVMAVLALAVGLLTGCGDKYEAVDSTVFIEKDGSVLSTDIESFDPATYDESGLKSFVEETIDAYTAEHGNASVSLKDLTFEDGQAKLTIQYASVADYTAFNEIELFSGSLAEALAAGYTFDGEFAQIKDGTKTLCDASAFLNGDGYKVVIIKANTNVHVNGKVQYVSADNVAMVDTSTVSISNENGADDTLVADDTEIADTQSEVVDTMTDSPSDADEGSVGEDDLLLDEENTEVVFVFDEDDQKREDSTASVNSNYTNKYTYIIYK